jgi:hypothetical protein
MISYLLLNLNLFIWFIMKSSMFSSVLLSENYNERGYSFTVIELDSLILLIYIFIKFYFIKNIYLSWLTKIIYLIIIKYFNSIWKLIKSAINKRYIILKNIIWIGFKSLGVLKLFFTYFILLWKGWLRSLTTYHPGL